MNTFSNGLFNEQAFALTVNGRNSSLFSCSQTIRMNSPAAILQPKQSSRLTIRVDGATIGVLTRNPFKVLLPKRAVISGCGGTTSYLDPARLTVISGGITIPSDTLAIPFPQNILDAGGYCAATVLPDGTIFTAGDLDQPVALDKACGLLLHAGNHPATAALVISSKPTADTIRKTLK
ncbi:MAG TPA: hypothetical protein O0X23_01880 [Methanocorpusculum sp.]|nr:hypothetical protein [Methanocorpusculum sp.]